MKESKLKDMSIDDVHLLIDEIKEGYNPEQSILGFPVVIDESAKPFEYEPIVLGDFHEAYGKCPCRFVKANIVDGKCYCTNCGQAISGMTCNVIDNPMLEK